MLNKGLGSTRNILGAYHLCFTDKTLSLVRKSTITAGNVVTTLLGGGGGGGGTGHMDHVEFSLMSIRRCGHTECFFYMEVIQQYLLYEPDIINPKYKRYMYESFIKFLSRRYQLW